MATKRKTIAEDTPILPHVVADGVLNRLQGWIHENRETLAGRMTDREDGETQVDAFMEALSRDGRKVADAMGKRADAAYEASTDFARKVNAPGNGGRDFLHSYMQHWLCAEGRELDDGAYEDVVDALPEGYAQGTELPAAASGLRR